MGPQRFTTRDLPLFDRDFFQSASRYSRIGDGEIGGKARGLVFISDILDAAAESGPAFPIPVSVPTFTVVTTDLFDAFMKQNDLYEIALSDQPDERIAHAFQRADLPIQLLGDLRALVQQAHTPLAVRSSSLLEDALFRPFAGVYMTKMTPNNQPDADTRFRKLSEAIKYIYASTFFKAAKNYIRATRNVSEDEKMAVVIQEVVGLRHGDRFYPDISGVCRSFNFYPTGGTKPEEGVVDLALGLGKTIVDGGLSFTYSPARPKASPPFQTVGDLLKGTQRAFWAVNMGKPPEFDPIVETEYMVRAGLEEAEYDGTLRFVASTYLAASDRMVPGTGSPGPRAVDFAPILVLEEFPVNTTLKQLLEVCERSVGVDVECEFAVTVGGEPGDRRAELGFLQVRPMVVSEEVIQITEDELASPKLLVSSDRVMGNGTVETIRDIVYVKPDVFEARHTPAIAAQLEKINGPLLAEGRPYLLIGFGRWGSSDPWLGIPVNWGQICGAQAIVEATLPKMEVDLSQGSHFFHNISSFRVSYFSVKYQADRGIDWDWLEAREAAGETEYLRHVRLDGPLVIKVDGRTSRGAIWRG